jgi:hypothetical protein
MADTWRTMADHDGRRRGSGDSLPGSHGAERRELPVVGKQSLVEKEFGAPVGPGPWVQRRSGGPAADTDVPGKQSLVEKEFGAPVRPGGDVQRRSAADEAGPASAPRPSSLMQRIFAMDDQRSVQRREAAPAAGGDPASVHAAAAQGVATPASLLPHGTTMQQLFGRHDVSNVQAHTGPEAAASANEMGAQAYATGNHVVLGGQTDLHTVAHEAAHAVQQRGGVQLKGGVGTAGDVYEQHADAVADAVVRGQSAEALLDQHAGPAVRACQRIRRGPCKLRPSWNTRSLH